MIISSKGFPTDGPVITGRFRRVTQPTAGPVITGRFRSAAPAKRRKVASSKLQPGQIVGRGISDLSEQDFVFNGLGCCRDGLGASGLREPDAVRADGTCATPGKVPIWDSRLGKKVCGYPAGTASTTLTTSFRPPAWSDAKGAGQSLVSMVTTPAAIAAAAAPCIAKGGNPGGCTAQAVKDITARDQASQKMRQAQFAAARAAQAAREKALWDATAVSSGSWWDDLLRWLGIS